MEKLFDNYKGVVLFYIMVLLLSVLYVMRVNELNRIAENNNVNKSYYAYKN